MRIPYYVYVSFSELKFPPFQFQYVFEFLFQFVVFYIFLWCRLFFLFFFRNRLFRFLLFWLLFLRFLFFSLLLFRFLDFFDVFSFGSGVPFVLGFAFLLLFLVSCGLFSYFASLSAAFISSASSFSEST